MFDYHCLWCNCSLRKAGSFKDLFYSNDCLCSKCRSLLNYQPVKINNQGLLVNSLYPYEGLVKESIIQYKEQYDQALNIIYIYPYIKRLRKKYHDYTLVLMPSFKTKVSERGFNHVRLLFDSLNLPISECLSKNADISQKTLSLEDRRKINDVIKLDEDVYFSKILLVDDIITSGATLQAGYQLLRGRSDKIEALTIAYNKSYQKRSTLIMKIMG